MGWGKINKLKITKSRKNFHFMNYLKCNHMLGECLSKYAPTVMDSLFS